VRVFGLGVGCEGSRREKGESKASGADFCEVGESSTNMGDLRASGESSTMVGEQACTGL